MKPTKTMNKQTKGDILAERIETILKGLFSPESFMVVRIREAIAEYRRSWTLGRSVNGFTLGDGQEWHRNDGWTQDLIMDRRPLIDGEALQAGDFGGISSRILLHHTHNIIGKTVGTSGDLKHSVEFYTTRRPLPEVKKPVLTTKQIEDGWVEWHGGECPVWNGSQPVIMIRDGTIYNTCPAYTLRWEHDGLAGDIIAYRPDPYEALKKAHADGKVIEWKYPDGGLWIKCTEDCPPQWLREIQYRIKPAPVMVPLGPDDVPPGSAIRPIVRNCWMLVVYCTPSGVFYNSGSQGSLSYAFMKDNYEISRDGGKTWQRCEKPEESK
jgi:hypothetical protein